MAATTEPLKFTFPTVEGWNAMGIVPPHEMFYGKNQNAFQWSMLKKLYLKNPDVLDNFVKLVERSNDSMAFPALSPLSFIENIHFLDDKWEIIRETWPRAARAVIENNKDWHKPDIAFIIQAALLNKVNFRRSMEFLDSYRRSQKVTPTSWLYVSEYLRNHSEFGDEKTVHSYALYLTNAFHNGSNAEHAKHFVQNEDDFMNHVKELKDAGMDVKIARKLFKTRFPMKDFLELGDIPDEWVYATM